ncbi:flavin monoamine oxidase family protein [Tropicimonas sp. TH_r6]|uniref:flavin monoamine oxidase family protein n=1 Tax=Tropicimonas sp. TH_r6 TaxID=3082085 RepID=UPI0039870ED4
MTECVVVGAGIAGLTAALCLQRAGKQVLILEGSRRTGGRVRSVSEPGSESVRFDTGPTWVWPRWQPHVQRWMNDLSVRSFPQFELGEAVLDGFGSQVITQPLPSQDGITRLVGGPGSIAEALEERLDPGTVRLGAEVTAIDVDGASLRLLMRDGTTTTCSATILAAPLRIVGERIGIGALDPDMSGIMRRIPTWMGQQAKAVILYDQPFWRDQGLSGRVASRVGPLVEIHDHSPEGAEMGALFGFVGWPAEDRRRDAEGLRAAILEQLVRCFGLDAAQPRDLILQDWAREPLICSEIDRATPPEHPVVGPDVLRDCHLDNRLWFAGSETSNISPGLIEGALVAGETTARRVLSTL